MYFETEGVLDTQEKVLAGEDGKQPAVCSSPRIIHTHSTHKVRAQCGSRTLLLATGTRGRSMNRSIESIQLAGPARTAAGYCC
jgi:hypothetical protein